MSDVLEEILARSTDRPLERAVRDLDRDLTYHSLVDEISHVAAGLADEGVVEGDRVALFLANSVDFVVSALACLWIGAAFLPLSVNDPDSRLESILHDSEPVFAISSEIDATLALGIKCVQLSSLRREGFGAPRVDSSAHRVSYVIYTSGTTGTPKGVQIGGSAFGAAVRSTAGALGIDDATTTLCVSPFHFDGSYANLFPTLTSGGSVVIRPRESLLFPRTFIKTVMSEHVTLSGFTPSYLRLLLTDPKMAELRGSTLAMIALGGEAVNARDLENLWSLIPNVRVFNRFGPTETTIAVTNYELTADVIRDKVVPIGYPHPDVDFYLLNDDGEIVVSAKQTGELYIGGVQLMEGYLGAPDLTAKVLRNDVVAGEVVYRSGDLIYRDEEGRYVYVERVDRVVKRRGVRISLLELNEVFKSLSGVTDAACLAYVDDGVTGIAIFVVASKLHTDLELRRKALRQLPETMMPDRIHFVETLPLNRSNKIDETLLLKSVGLASAGAASTTTAT
jgi:D-alanine--poly(phosphoribitol) ligase subunit 1